MKPKSLVVLGMLLMLIVLPFLALAEESSYNNSTVEDNSINVLEANKINNDTPPIIEETPVESITDSNPSQDKLGFFMRTWVDYSYDNRIDDLNGSNQSSAVLDPSQIQDFNIVVGAQDNDTYTAFTNDPNAADISVEKALGRIKISDNSPYKYLFSVAINYSDIEPYVTDGQVQMTHYNDAGAIDAVWNQSVENISGLAIFENIPFSTVTIHPLASPLLNFGFESWTGGALDNWSNGTSAGLFKSTVKLNGSYAYGVTGLSSAATRGEIIQDISTNTRLNRVSFWVKSSGWTDGQVQIFVHDGLNGHYISLAQNYADWTYVTSTWTAPTADQAGAFIGIYGTSDAANLNTGATFYIDDLVVGTDLTYSAVETSDNGHLYQTFTYTPVTGSANQTLVTAFTSWNIDSWTNVTGVSVTVDGVAKTAYIYKNNVYIDVSGISSAAHTIAVTVTIPSSVVPTVATFDGSPVTGTAPYTTTFLDTSTINTGSETASPAGTGGSQCTVARSTTYARTGTNSLATTGTSTATSGTYATVQALHLELQSSTAYYWEAYVYCPTATGIYPNGIGLWEWAGGYRNTALGTISGSGAYQTLPANTWTKISGTGVTYSDQIAQNTLILVPAFSSASAIDTTKTLYYDDIVVYPITSAPTSWSWNFGDGVTSTTKDPTHQYNQSGTYTVALTTANSAGSSTHTHNGYVSVIGSTILANTSQLNSGWNLEGWTAGVTSFPDGWTGQQGTINRSTDSALGIYSARIDGYGSTTGLAHTSLAGYPAGWYTLSCWMKVTGRTSGTLSLNTVNETTWTGHGWVAQSGNTDWVYKTTRFYQPAGGSGTFIRYYVDSSPNPGSHFYIDGITLTPDASPIADVETNNATAISSSFSYTPAGTYTNATLQFTTANYTLSGYSFTNATAYIDGVAKSAYVNGNQVYVNTGGLSAAAHAVVVQLNKVYVGSKGDVYVPSNSINSMIVMNKTSNQIMSTIRTSQFAYGQTVSLDGSRVYVVGGDGKIDVIDTATNTRIATWEIPGGSNTNTCTVTPDGTKLYINDQTTGNVHCINTATGAVIATISCGTAGSAVFGVKVNPAGTKLYVTAQNDNTVRIIDTATNTITKTIGVPAGPFLPMFKNDGSRAYIPCYSANQLTVIDTSTEAITANVSGFNSPRCAVMSLDGTKLFVTNNGNASVAVVTSGAIVANIGIPASPRGISLSMDGTKVYVATATGNAVSVIDVATNAVIANVTDSRLNTPMGVGIFVQPTALPFPSFTKDVSNGNVPFTVTFTDTSGGAPTSWDWNWGDGTAHGNTQNPTHQYTTVGTYTVTLTATNTYGSTSTTSTIYSLPAKPVAHFIGNKTSGSTPLGVAFSDLSTNTPTSWLWDFGDGSTSTTRNPTHTYMDAGVYGVTLTATNAGGSSVSTDGDYITALPNAVDSVNRGIWINDLVQSPDYYSNAAYNIGGTSGFVILTVGQDWEGGVCHLTFPGTTTGYYDFSSTDDAAPILNQLRADGRKVILSIQPNQASVPVLIDAVLTRYASYNDIILGVDIDMYSKHTGTDMHIANAERDVYVNKIKGYNSTYKLFMTYYSPDISYYPSDNASQVLLFDSQADTQTQILSDYSSIASRYTNVGLYTGYTTNTPTRTTSDASIISAAANTQYIAHIEFDVGESPMAVASFTADSTSGAVPKTVQFTSTSANAPTSYYWRFGDGTTSTSASPSHIYTSSGTYTVQLTATNAQGSSTCTKSSYISAGVVNVPQSAFTSSVAISGTQYRATFTDTSTNAPTSWAWSFGDGGTSTDQNPIHNYALAGTYTATLTVTNSGGSTTLSHNVVCTSEGGSTTTSSYSKSYQAALQMMSCQENSNPAPYWNYAENIGDGRGITMGICGFTTGTYDAHEMLRYYTTLNPNNVFVKYDAALTAIDNGPHNGAGGDGNPSTTGLNGFITDVQNCNDPMFKQAQLYTMNQMYYNEAVSQFTKTGCSYNLTLAVLFDASVREGADGMTTLVTQATTACGGTPKTGVSETVFLTSILSKYHTMLANEAGTDDKNRDADYRKVLTNGNQVLNCPYTFTAWGESFTITGVVPGLENIGGGGPITPISIPNAPVPAFIASTTRGAAPLTVGFTDQSTNTPTSWSWTFGDGTSSNIQNPSHVYSTAGIYTVKLLAANSAGSTVLTKTSYITAVSGTSPITAYTSGVWFNGEIWINKATYTPAKISNAAAYVNGGATGGIVDLVVGYGWSTGDCYIPWAGTTSYSNVAYESSDLVTPYVQKAHENGNKIIFNIQPMEADPLNVISAIGIKYQTYASDVEGIAIDMEWKHFGTDDKVSSSERDAYVTKIHQYFPNAKLFLINYEYVDFTVYPSDNVNTIILYDGQSATQTAIMAEYHTVSTHFTNVGLYTGYPTNTPNRIATNEQIITAAPNTRYVLHVEYDIGENPITFPPDSGVPPVTPPVTPPITPPDNPTDSPYGNGPLLGYQIGTPMYGATIQMTTTSENSQTAPDWDYAANIGDGRGITFGFCGFTTGTYDGNEFIKYYTTLNSSNVLKKYITALDAIDAGAHDNDGCSDNVTGLNNFIADVRVAARDPMFVTAQMNQYNHDDWLPAYSQWVSTGSKNNLTLAFIVDMCVRHGAGGSDGSLAIINTATSSLGGNVRSGKSETAFLNELFVAREAALRGDNAGQPDNDNDRCNGYKLVLSTGNVKMVCPYGFEAYGDPFTITGNLGIKGTTAPPTNGVTSFTYSPYGGGAAPITITFTDTSTVAGKDTWYWNFGDGSTSTSTSSVQNPTHTYTAPGLYTVTLNVHGTSGTATTTKTVTITGSSIVLPVAGFTFAPNGGQSPIDITFTDTSTNAYSRQWNFGDGSASVSTKSPVHTFTGAGTFTVTQTAYGSSGGSSVVTHSVVITGVTAIAPVASFAANPTVGNLPTTVHFTDTSINTPTSWAWTFGDGGTAVEMRPSHTYTVAGTYNVVLTATNSAGGNTITHNGLITVNAATATLANFTVSKTLQEPTKAIQYTYTGTGTEPSSYNWNFGDGTTSTERNPTHAYKLLGAFPVQLSVGGYGGTSNATAKTITITSVPFQNYSQYSKQLFTANMTQWDFLQNSVGIYTTFIPADIFYLIICLIMFLPLYIRTGSVLLPCVIFCFIGGFFAFMVPIWASSFFLDMFILGTVGLIYKIFIQD